MRKYLVFIVFIVGAACLSLGTIFWYFTQTGAPTDNKTEKRFVITKGSSATKIASDLEKAGLIKSALAFKVYAQLNGISGNIPPGEFSVPQNLNIEELINHLKKGPKEVWVTIPEGLRREEIADKVISQLEVEASKVSSFRQEFLEESEDSEGMLFPDTYLFPREVTPEKIVSQLVSTFEQKYQKEVGNNVTSGLTKSEIIVLASIIEREAITNKERPEIARILLNRIEADWPLQADATVQYALGTEKCSRKIENCKWWEPPLRADLEVDSPFNTYKITGLPPKPIANPGIASLKAAANPGENDYMFYIHDKEGEVHYAKTLEEHNQNVARYLR